MLVADLKVLSESWWSLQSFSLWVNTKKNHQRLKHFRLNHTETSEWLYYNKSFCCFWIDLVRHRLWVIQFVFIDRQYADKHLKKTFKLALSLLGLTVLGLIAVNLLFWAPIIKLHSIKQLIRKHWCGHRA